MRALLEGARGGVALTGPEDATLKRDQFDTNIIKLDFSAGPGNPPGHEPGNFLKVQSLGRTGGMVYEKLTKNTLPLKPGQNGKFSIGNPDNNVKVNARGTADDRVTYNGEPPQE